MTYSQTAQGVQISKARAFGELARHHCGDVGSIQDFLRDLGNRDTYTATEVLQWLGY